MGICLLLISQPDARIRAHQADVQNFYDLLDVISPDVDAEQDPDPPEPPDTCWLDKTYQCLHFLLTGTDWEGDPPLSFLLAWGKENPSAEFRTFTSREVKKIANALERISDEELRTRYDPPRMAKLGLYGFYKLKDLRKHRDSADAFIEELLAYFNELKSFVARSARDRLGMIIAMT